MALPTRKVTCQLYDQQGNPAAKAKIQFRLTGTELIDGVVAPELFEQEADDTGLAIFEVVPNVLGVNGTQYQVRAWNPDTGKKFLDGFCTVPDQDVGLHQILLTDPPPTIDSAQQAVIAAQAAALEAANSANAAYDSETTVAASVAAALASEIASLASQEAAAISATESASSASDALASELAAKLSETNANTSEGASLASEQAAAASAVDSAASALAALGSEQAAAASATDANAAVPVWAALAPPAPINGAIWIDSNSGREFKWYEDGSSGQWVETGAVVQMGYETAAVIEVAAASAMDSKLAAEASAAEATASKDTAVSSAAASLDSENKAHLWAAAPRGTVVADGEYSAKHWALEAQQAAEGALVYRGLFSAADGVYPANPSLGDYYRISEGGAINGVSYAAEDSIIYNGSSWDKTESSNAVVSVAGRVGSVVLSKADVGLDNVDNTSDVNKPVSTAQASALATKQDTLANGTNIKSLNGESVLGAGNIEILGGPTVSDTEPPTPKNGQEWVDGVTGIKYTWVDDGSSAQWVELGPGGTPAATSVFLRNRSNHTGTQDASSVLLAGVGLDSALPALSTEDRDRANHTGTQAISTVSGLQTALDAKQPSLGFTPVINEGIARLHWNGAQSGMYFRENGRVEWRVVWTDFNFNPATKADAGANIAWNSTIHEHAVVDIGQPLTGTADSPNGWVMIGIRKEAPGSNRIVIRSVTLRIQ